MRYQIVIPYLTIEVTRQCNIQCAHCLRGDAGQNVEVGEVTTVEQFNDAIIYLNCNGDIIYGCDWSYESQDEKVVCHVDKLTKVWNDLEGSKDAD